MICSRCTNDKPLGEFYGRDGRCKGCRNTMQNATRRARKLRERETLNSYGISGAWQRWSMRPISR